MIKSVISDTSNMGLKPKCTGNNYNKVEKLWNDFSGNTRSFPKMNNMGKTDSEGAGGTQLVTSLNIFSTWMMSQPKTVLDGQKKLCWSL